MNHLRRLACLLCLVSVACSPTCCDDPASLQATSTFPELRGPYLGQAPPGLEPEIFAPGIVSTGLATRDIAMTPDGGELYFAVTLGGRTMIMVTRQQGGVWTEPAVAPFSGRYLDIEPAISPDGQRFFFLSTRDRRPGQEEKSGWVYQDIWVMDREGDVGRALQSRAAGQLRRARVLPIGHRRRHPLLHPRGRGSGLGHLALALCRRRLR